jgi:hypothetical protein
MPRLLISLLITLQNTPFAPHASLLLLKSNSIVLLMAAYIPVSHSVKSAFIPLFVNNVFQDIHFLMTNSHANLKNRLTKI